MAFRCGTPGTVILRKLTMMKVDEGEVAPGLSLDLKREPKMPRAAYIVLWEQLGETARVTSEVLEDPNLRRLALHRALEFERRKEEPTGPPERRWQEDGVEFALWGDRLSLVNLTVKEVTAKLPSEGGEISLKPHEVRFVKP